MEFLTDHGSMGYSERCFFSVSCSQSFLSRTSRITYENIDTLLETRTVPGDHHIDDTDGAVQPAENDHHFAYKRYACKLYPA
jgi:hypothetical protein